MRICHRTPYLFASLLALMVGLAPAWAAEPTSGPATAEIQLQRGLDRPIDLVLDKVDLTQALQKIADTAKISILVDDTCYDDLPYGQTALISVVFRASTTRDAIQEIIDRLGWEQVVSGSNLIIRPTRALALIGRRAEWDELKLLKDLRSNQLPNLDKDWTPQLRTLLGRPDLLVKIDKLDPAANDKALAQVRSVLPCSISQALDIYANATGQVWTVQNQSILILPMKKWIERQLDRPVVLHFANAPLANVIAELSRISRIRLQPEPGLYQAIPQIGAIDSDNATLQRTLDTLSGSTGIVCEIRDDSIYLRLSDKQRSGGTTGTLPESPIIGRVAVPLTSAPREPGVPRLTLDLFIKESDLPPEINELRKKRVAEAVLQMQQGLINPPTTVPVPTPTPSPASSTAPATSNPSTTQAGK